METSRRVTFRRFYFGDKIFLREPSGRFWADAAYHEQPSVTLERLARLESVMASEIEEIKKMMKDE